ncbi:MAG: hypothetical protein HZB43_02965 [candidate division Zixibacteria bacterium]|nr:hypothetical protein [candidate division Zixibacteria bacterium]
MTSPEELTADLKVEREYYETNRAEYLKLYQGKFVLIRGQQMHGSFDTFEAAYTAGLDLFGNVPMFIRRVEESDPPVNLPSLFLGLLGGHVSARIIQV